MRHLVFAAGDGLQVGDAALRGFGGDLECRGVVDDLGDGTGDGVVHPGLAAGTEVDGGGALRQCNGAECEQCTDGDFLHVTSVGILCVFGSFVIVCRSGGTLFGHVTPLRRARYGIDGVRAL